MNINEDENEGDCNNQLAQFGISSDEDSESNDEYSQNELSKEYISNNSLGDIKSVSDWHTLVSNWIELVENEEISLQDNVNLLENTVFDEGNEDLEFVDTSSITHPADDVEAKWKLQDLFRDSLGQPAYLTLLINE